MITDEQLKALRYTRLEWMVPDEPATDPQKGYIAILVQDREVPEHWLQRIKEYEETGKLTKAKASQIIGSLKGRPLKPDVRENRSINDPRFKDVPAGYYAIEVDPAHHDGNDILFYQVWKPKHADEANKAYVGRVYIIHGPDETKLDHKQALGVLKAITRFGLGRSAVLYGQKIGRCSQCHRRLSNRISRELATGPVCGGRVYGEDWGERVNSATQAILARGEDPKEGIG